MAPWLTVIVPSFNAQRYIAATLDSVLAEADDGVEIIVSDDGSDDDTIRVVERYTADRRVLLLRGTCRGNWAANSNFAACHAKAPLITFLHQDDLWLPGRIERLRLSLLQCHNDSLRINPTRYIDARGRTVGHWYLPFSRQESVVSSGMFLERLLVQNFIAMPAPVFPRRTFLKIGGLDENLWYTADWDLWLKMGAVLPTVVDHAEVTAFRVHAESQTQRGNPESMREQTEIVRQRHLSRIKDATIRDDVDRAGRVSMEVNAALASLAADLPIRWQPLLRSIASLRPASAQRLIRDSRLYDRVHARLRVG